MVQLSFLPRTATAKGVGEPDTSLAVYRQIIGPIVAVPLQPVRQLRHPAVRLEAGDAVIPRLAPIETALGIEHQPVGAVRPGTEFCARAGMRIIPHDAVARDMGKQQGLTVPGRSFRGTPIGASDQFEFPIHKLSPLWHTRCCTVEEGIIQYQSSRTTRYTPGLNGD